MIEKFGPFIFRSTFIPHTSTVLGETEQGYVFKQTDPRGNRNEIKYSTNQRRTFITGFLENSQTYHISTVTNAAGTEAGIRDLPQLLNIME